MLAQAPGFSVFLFLSRNLSSLTGHLFLSFYWCPEGEDIRVPGKRKEKPWAKRARRSDRRIISLKKTMAYLANLRLGNNGWRPEVGSLTTVGKTRGR